MSKKFLSPSYTSSPSLPPASLSPASSTRATAKNTIKTALILLEKAADGWNIPGLKAASGTIVEVIKIAEKRKQNTNDLEELSAQFRRLEDSMISPLLGRQNLGVSPELEARIRRLVEELVILANSWTHLKTSHTPLLSFINHEDYSAEIASLDKLIKRSLDAFSLDSHIAVTMIGESTHRTLGRVEKHLLSKEIQGLPYANAAYDSISRNNAPKCFQGTRTMIFNLLRNWIGDRRGPNTCVLEGIAGVGKTTIVQTLAEEEEKTNRLAATFIFSRDENERNKADLFFTTLAYQLAQHSEEFASRISLALQHSPDAPRKTLAKQLEKLIVEPLQDLPLSTSLPRLIILDAMDECEKEGATQILRLLLDHIPFFKILITTRPEPHIRAVLDAHKDHESLVLHELDEMIVDDDIRRYLKYQLTEQEVEMAVPGCRWQLRTEDLDALVEAAGQLFIVASTAVKFIKDEIQADPQYQLKILLGGFAMEESADLSPYTTLDQLYTQVLETAIPSTHSSLNIIQRFQKVVGTIIVLQNPLSPRGIAALLGVGIAPIDAVLRRLQSVIVTSGENQVPRVYHPSFHDFITSSNRCKNLRFFIEPPVHHNRVVTHCFELMGRMLRRNICDISLPEQYLENSEIPELPLKVANHIPDELVYACSYWAVHLDKTGVEVGGLLDLLETFAQHHLLFWLEVLSLLGIVKTGYLALALAIKFAVLRRGSAQLLSILNDGQRFVMASQEVIKVSALHVYYSALPFTPSETALFQKYKNEAQNSIKILLGQRSHWDPLLAVLAGHTKSVRCAAFSPDGTRIASGSDDMTIRLWDGASGAQLATLEDHYGEITSLAFTSDGKRLASGSHDMTIILWDSVAGARIAALKGHSGSISSIAFTSDGEVLASASHDKTVRLWDCKNGAHIITLEGHSEEVISVAFSSAKNRLASSSLDRTVRLWNWATGAHVATLQTHSGSITSIAFTHDGTRLTSASDDQTIMLWDGITGTHIATLSGHSEEITSVTFTCDGNRLASGSWDNTVKLWNGVTGSHIATLEGHSRRVWCVAFTPDGKRLASGSADTTVKLWDGETGAPIATLDGHSGRVWCVAFASDGKRLISGSDDRTVRLWDSWAGPYVATPKGHSSTITSIEFSPDGARLISTSIDNEDKQWDLATTTAVNTQEDASGHFAYPAPSRLIDSVSHPLPLQITWKSDLLAIVVVSGQPPVQIPICLLPFGSSLGAANSLATRMAAGLDNGQLLVLDAAHVRLD